MGMARHRRAAPERHLATPLSSRVRWRNTRSTRCPATRRGAAPARCRGSVPRWPTRDLGYRGFRGAPPLFDRQGSRLISYNRPVKSRLQRIACLLAVLPALLASGGTSAQQTQPNIVLIYADDLGYGDVSAYGATALRTPSIDRVASEGLRFTDGHATAATCTPSRYSLLTGEYAFRRPGTGVLPGNAALIIEPGRTTLASMLRRAGYTTGVVGKWHLGLGAAGGPDWNGDVRPSPNDVGFDSSFIMAATGDRVPTVYVENRRVAGLDASDPISVSYSAPLGDWPTGSSRPDLLTRMRPSHGHDQTIVNGISRIGYMTGGKAALWRDEDMADVFTARAVSFIERNRAQPFFLFFSLHDPHVPRVPHPRFVGKTTMGPRGDAIVQADWSVGDVLHALDRLNLAANTLVIVTSDNGPVIDDGYQDDAVTKLGAHRPSGPFRGGKYSHFEAGTRVPLVVRWPARVKPGVSGALVSQVDLLASLAALVGQTLAPPDSPDGINQVDTWLGRSRDGREQLIEQAAGLALRVGRWKYIEASQRPQLNAQTNTELGNDRVPQLYDLDADPGETTNLAAKQPARTAEMGALAAGKNQKSQVGMDVIHHERGSLGSRGRRWGRILYFTISDQNGEIQDPTP
jgi:arylsulfatase A-like enzyme